MSGGIFNILILIIILPLSKCAVPGNFFWRPRLAIDLSPSQPEPVPDKHNATRENIENGLVTLVDGYDVGMTVVALASSFADMEQLPSVNPSSAQYYTNIYRWTLRHLSLLPYWLGGRGLSYADTHKVWRRRFYYMEDFVPEWIRPLIPLVDTEEWIKEEKELSRYNLYAEPSFGKHYRYPSKTFNKFRSQETEETVENLDSSSGVDSESNSS